jgi:hypothetical protein
MNVKRDTWCSVVGETMKLKHRAAEAVPVNDRSSSICEQRVRVDASVVIFRGW